MNLMLGQYHFNVIITSILLSVASGVLVVVGPFGLLRSTSQLPVFQCRRHLALRRNGQNWRCLYRLLHRRRGGLHQTIHFGVP